MRSRHSGVIKNTYRYFSINMSSDIGKVEEINPTANQTGVIVFLHGSGDTGHGAKAWIDMLMGSQAAFPHLKILFPTAPLRPYAPLGGNLSHVWFNRWDITPFVPEDLETIEPMAKELRKFIEQQVDKGIPLNRIVLGGFSMGGAMSLLMGYHFLPGLGGIFALSSFLNENSVVYESLKTRMDDPCRKPLPPLFMCHGDRDDLVNLSWSEETFAKLKANGVTVNYTHLPNMLHELKKKELHMLYEWINNTVPVVGDKQQT